MRRPEADTSAADQLRQAHRRPRPKLQEGMNLVEEGVLAAIDLSDGLVDDTMKMMKASGMAASLDSWRIPVHPSLKAVFPHRAIALALAGGEDYELLYAAPQNVMDRTLARVPSATVIGSVVPGDAGEVLVQDQEGNRLPGLERGWDHFRR